MFIVYFFMLCSFQQSISSDLLSSTYVTAHGKSVFLALAIGIILHCILIRKFPKTNPFPIFVVCWTETLLLFCILVPYDRTLAAAHAYILFFSVDGAFLGNVLGEKGSPLYMDSKAVLLGALILICNSLLPVYLSDASDLLFFAAITGINLLILVSVYLSKKAVGINN